LQGFCSFPSSFAAGFTQIMIRRTFVAVVAATLFLPVAQLGVAPCRAESAASPQIAASLQPFIDSHTLAGAVTLVASRDKILSLETIGCADLAAKKPMQADSLFWIASMTKPITATALMMLVDEGKVNINDPVEKYLPEFKGQMLATGPDKDHPQLKKPTRPVTVKDLLTHTGGLTNPPPGDRRWDMFPLADLAKIYAKLPLKFDPGTKYEYSNPGINTLGRIIEVASGVPYAKFMQDRLFTPLGMCDTTFWPSTQQLARLAKTYKPTADKKGLEETTIAAFTYPLSNRQRTPIAAGGLFSTAKDLSLFCRMIFCGGEWNGRRYVSAKAVREMSALHTAKPFPPRGLGWAATTPGGPFGHGGAYKTNMQIDPQQQLVTILLVQHAVWGGDGQRVLPTFIQAANGAFGRAPVPSPANKLSDAEQAAGWKLLFDGRSTAGWRNFKKPDVSPGWKVIDGALCRVAKGAGDLISAGQYGNFELELDYKVPSHANSGIMYRVSEEEVRAPFTGVEFQILDNADPKGDPQKAGWAYALYQPPTDPKTGRPVDATRPAGQWNHVRLVCNGPHVEHWMNGVKYCAYEIGSDDWNRRVAASKFAKWPKFAKYAVGHIALQGDHGDVCFANIKLRELPAK
jgi:CubicO group peptidase (beta-lactamase class C family)